MLKVGITGGIGSGKTVVCQVFETLGIPVFNADAAAKFLMEHDVALIKQIKLLFGEEVYEENKLKREKLAAIIFQNEEKRHALNAVVHPATIEYGEKWMEQQTAPYALKEAAILFESGSHKGLDKIIGVYAPQEIRIQRAMQRDGATREKIESRIATQMNEEEKMKLCDFVIENDGKTAIIPQVLNIHKQLVNIHTHINKA